MYNSLTLNYEPVERVKILTNGESVKYSEMTDFQQAFLCGAIKEKKPKKILEVGVSAGGTTAVILECLKELGNECEMYSVDWLDFYYLEPEKQVGFFARNNMEKICGKTCHRFLSGNSIPFFIEEIGAEIDCLILDTCHRLPGELMDFIAVLPFLKNGCMVILHDVGENMLNLNEGHEEDIATKLLFTSVSGKKYYMPENDPNLNEYMISNIAAFVVDETTGENIDNSVMALSSTWQMALSVTEVKKYREIVRKYHKREVYNLFERVTRAQERLSIIKEVKKHYGGEIHDLVDKWKEAKGGVYLYGAGHYAGIYMRFAKINGLEIRGIIVSDGHQILPVSESNLPIIHLADNNPDESYHVVLALDKTHWPDILKNVEKLDNFSVIGCD